MTMRLLVSVRNGSEAAIAAASGADIIDVKEPDHGSLGFAGEAMIAEVVRAVRGRCPVSAAFGECVEWKNRSTSGCAKQSLLLRLSDRLAYIKTGLAGTVQPGLPLSPMAATANHTHAPVSFSAEPGWTECWQQTHRKIEQSCGWDDVAESDRPAWVAVAYADHITAQSPPPADILAAAVHANCAGLLIDTFGKNGGTTFDCLSITQLADLRREAADRGLFFALAGRLDEQHLPFIGQIAPDIVAVRGAVCEGSERRAAICGERITRLKKALCPGD